MIGDSVKTFDPWLTTCAVYLYGQECLCCISEIDNKTEYTLAVPSCDWEILEKEYADGVLALSDAKQFVFFYHYVLRKTKDARRMGGSWVSQAWVEGRV